MTKRRQMAIERMDREKKEREEKEAQELAEADKKKAIEGAGKAVDSGDAEALQKYEDGWKKKVDMYGVDAVRDKVAKEMGSGGQSKQAVQATPGGFDFAPPIRESIDLLPAVRQQQPAAASSRRQERKPVDVSSFRFSDAGKDVDNADRQFSVLSEEVHVGWSNGSARNSGQGAVQRTAGAAADTSTMPLIWEQRQAANLAAEAECLQRNMEIANASTTGDSSAAAFKASDLTGLD